MASDDKSAFLLFHSHEDFFNALNNDQIADLMRAIFAYEKRGIDPELDPITSMAFIAIKQDLDRNKEKWVSKKKSRSEAGRLGGVASGKSRSKQTLKNEANEANVQKTKQTKQTKQTFKSEANEAVNVNGNVNVDVNDKYKNIVQNADDFEPSLSRNSAINCDSYPNMDKMEQKKQDEQRHKDQEAEALFEELWRTYPVKRGKGSVSRTQKLKLAKIGKDELVRAIDRYKKDVESASFDLSYKNGSTFFNSGYVDYLDANYTPREKPQGKVVGQSALATRYTASSGTRDFSHLEE